MTEENKEDTKVEETKTKKKKKKTSAEPKKEVDARDKDIIKKYGEIIWSAYEFIDNPPPVISVSPKIDVALGGGVPEGCLFIMTGPEKVGKTVTALNFVRNAQKVKLDNGQTRTTHYANIEGRIKKRDLQGIYGLNLDPAVFKIIGSKVGHILSGEDYVSILDNRIHNDPHSVCVVDSFSALASEEELNKEINESSVAPMNRVLSKFTRRFANVLPVNRVTLVGITHLMANIKKFGAGKEKTEKSGNALKYAQDVKLWATHKEMLKQGESIIGQKVHWVIENSAIGPPGQKVTSIIKFGRGIWEEYEVLELAQDFGIVENSTWLSLPSGEKIQGKSKYCQYLEENENAFLDLKSQVYELVGI